MKEGTRQYRVSSEVKRLMTNTVKNKIISAKILLLLIISCLVECKVYAISYDTEKKCLIEERQTLQNFIDRSESDNEFIELINNEIAIDFLVKTICNFYFISDTEQVAHEDRVNALQSTLWHIWDKKNFDLDYIITKTGDLAGKYNIIEKKKEVESQKNALLRMGVFVCPQDRLNTKILRQDGLKVRELLASVPSR